jgi:regulator of nonsense transcripts 1
MEFSSREFYKGELQSGKCPSLFIPPKGFPWPKCSKGIHKPVAYVSCNSPEVSTGTSKSNPGEAQLLVKILLRLLQAGMKPKDIGIITPYAGQIATIRSILKSHSCPPIDLNSVDAFQGREKQMILFSSVRNGTQLGFVSDYRRLNVMHTRSKSGLIVIGNENTLKKDFVWKKWFQWVKGNQLQVPVPLIE